VFEFVIGSAPAIGIATASSHLDGRAVKKILCLIEQQMESAADFTFAGRKSGAAWHNVTDTLKCIRYKLIFTDPEQCENAPD